MLTHPPLPLNPASMLLFPFQAPDYRQLVLQIFYLFIAVL